MKKLFSKSTGIIALFVLLAACNKKTPPVFFKGNNGQQNILSGPIDLSTAKSMRLHYKNSKENLKTIYLDAAGNPVLDTLEGFVFSVSDIENLIKDANGKKAKDLVFYLGRDAKDISIGGKTYPSYAIISMAIDSTNKLGQLAYDKADPCPPNCPDDN